MSDTLSRMVYGQYILTALKKGSNLKTRDKDYLAAGTINWVSQISFEPPMLVIAVKQLSDLNETIDYSGRFTLHLLDEKQADWVTRFAGDSRIEDGKINGQAFAKKEGNLILEEAAAYISCKVVKTENMGDHTLHYGEVVEQKNLKTGAVLGTLQLDKTYSEG